MWKGEQLNSRHPDNYLDSKALSWTKSAIVIYLGHMQPNDWEISGNEHLIE